MDSANYRSLLVPRVDCRAFNDNIATLQLYVFTPTMCMDDYVDLFQRETVRLVDKHAPLRTRCRRVGRNECRIVDGCSSRRVQQSATANVSIDGIDVLVTRLIDGRMLRHDLHATTFWIQGLTTSSSGSPRLPEITPPGIE